MVKSLTNGVPQVSPRAGKPPAVFPGAIAGDAQLAIAVNRNQTQLALGMAATDTTMTVASVANITNWSLFSIDNEIVQVNNFAAGNVVPITRGFDGTTPALHLAGATVAGLIDAYHHNTLVSEIEAIETALGPNLINLGAQSMINTAFIFPPQTPGGSLIVGNNAITLSPVPRGINGTDTNHRVYISGGTGTPEAALITGGSAVSGAASGQLIIQCANTHSGAWTIATATAGIQEAYQSIVSAGSNGAIFIANRNNQVYATVLIDSGNIVLRGYAHGSMIQAANGALINSGVIQTTPNATGFNIFNCTIDGNQSNGGTTGNSGVVSCLYIRSGDTIIDGCLIRFANRVGIFVGDSVSPPQNVSITNCQIHDNGGVSGHGGSGSGYFGNGIFLGNGSNIRILNNNIYNNHNFDTEPGDGCGVNISGVTNLLVSDNYFLNNYNVGGGQLGGVIYTDTTNTKVGDGYWVFTGNVLCCTGTWGTPADKTDGIEVAARECTVAGNVCYGMPNGNGIKLDGPGSGNMSITGNVIKGTLNGILLMQGPFHKLDHVLITGNVINASQWGIPVDNIHTYISIRDNDITGTAQDLAGTFSSSYFLTNNLYSRAVPLVQVTMTASPMTYIAGHFREMISIMGATTLSAYVNGSYTVLSGTGDLTYVLNPNDTMVITYTGTPTMIVYYQL